MLCVLSDAERAGGLVASPICGISLNQSMTEAIFLTLGRSRSSRFKKLGLRPNAEAEGMNYVNFALGTPSEAIIVKWSASNIIS